MDGLISIRVLEEQHIRGQPLDQMPLLTGTPLDRNPHTSTSRHPPKLPPTSHSVPSLHGRSKASLPGLLAGMNPWLQIRPPIPVYLEGSAFRRPTAFKEKPHPPQRRRDLRQRPAIELRTLRLLILNEQAVSMPVPAASGHFSRVPGFILKVCAIHPKTPKLNRGQTHQVRLLLLLRDTKAPALSCVVTEVEITTPQVQVAPRMISSLANQRRYPRAGCKTKNLPIFVLRLVLLLRRVSFLLLLS